MVGGGGSVGPRSQEELAQILSDQKAMRERSLNLVAQLNTEHAAALRLRAEKEKENEVLKGVVRDLSLARDAKSAAMVDSVVGGALVQQEARFMRAQNKNLAEANKNMYESVVRAESSAQALRDELSEARMQLKVSQKLHETEQKNSLQSFAAVGRLKKELAEAQTAAMQSRMEHLEHIRTMEGQLAQHQQHRQASDSLVEQLKAASAASNQRLRVMAEDVERTKAHVRVRRVLWWLALGMGR